MLLILSSLILSKNSIAESKNIAFYDYLQQINPPPSLIAYNPSNVNPDNLQLNIQQITDKIHNDLSCLHSGFNGLVLYSYSNNITPIVMEQAYLLGYRSVLLGMWDLKSKQEFSGLLEIINQYHNKLALAVIIGNEGINDNRYSLEDIKVIGAKFIKAGVTKLGIPISSSEPMSRYGRAELRTFGDFLAPNIHPFFDRKDLEPQEAANWVHSQAEVLAKIAKKPVLVKETGLPNGGNPNITPEQQYQFWRIWHEKNTLKYLSDTPRPWISFAVVFEAFDSPWKAIKSGNPIEGHWGLLNENLKKYPAFSVFSDSKQVCTSTKD